MADEIPEEFAGIMARRVLWKEYGVQNSDWTYEEIINAIELDAAIERRHARMMEQANRGQ